MILNNISTLSKGDWVKGKPQNGELIIGFVERMGSLEGVVSVTVATSDKKDTVGKTIQMLTKNVEKLPEFQAETEEELQYLIDLALLTGDEDWFLELTSKLNKLRQPVMK
ncbi:IDEAL domain-containing protein [Salipaludibacillus daqingensis]|uniref:IDEAL domain-containing protein n=1 Tax=Salipaludibacillus daqingensis TaxID=3041001 RepID=UPI00247688A0|nr:IDEAL domain-containing protein [Salipaludibacillus daqingensis]